MVLSCIKNDLQFWYKSCGQFFLFNGKTWTYICCVTYTITCLDNFWILILGIILSQGPGGVTVKKTNMALVIGIYDEPMTPGQCNMVVERLGDYLVEQGL